MARSDAPAHLGAWYSYCCHMDLHKIESEDDVQEIRDLREDGVGVSVWPTRREALLDLRRWESAEGKAAIDRMLAEEP